MAATLGPVTLRPTTDLAVDKRPQVRPAAQRFTHLTSQAPGAAVPDSVEEENLLGL